MTDSLQPTDKINVIFVTSVFGQVHNGPALYANYLWHQFKDDSQVNFHLVTPESKQKHPRIHRSGLHFNSGLLYKNLQLKAIELAKSLTPQKVIIHSNNAHCMSLFKKEHGYLIGQFNDYDAARILSEPFRVLAQGGLRRLLSLTQRHYNESRALKKLNLGICNSEFVFAEVLKHYGTCYKRNLTVLHKGIDLSEFSTITLKSSAARSKNDLLFVGSNWTGKGLDIAIQAMSQLPTHLNHINLKVAGKSNSESHIRRLTEKLGLADRVKFLGNVARTDLPELMANSSVLIFPSHNEALGVAVIEAVAAGLPVIASNTGGIPEVLSSTQCSRLIKNLPKLFTQEIISVLNDYPSRDAIEVDRKYIKRQFNLNDLTTKLKSIYLSARKD